jgi:hypothetical protein
MIFLWIGLAVWLLLGWFGARLNVFEQIYYYGRSVEAKTWLLMMLSLIGGLFTFFVFFIDAERENVRRTFFLSPVKKPAKPDDHLLFKTIAGKLFGIKESK